jgi:hypothetical protein
MDEIFCLLEELASICDARAGMLRRLKEEDWRECEVARIVGHLEKDAKAGVRLVRTLKKKVREARRMKLHWFRPGCSQDERKS